jgi:predicted nucleic acid-binding protein
MAHEVFLDSAGLYALADHRDPVRTSAVACVRNLMQAKRWLVLTDYVVDEAATLAKSRGGSYGALRLIEIVERSRGFRMEWIGPQRFESAKAFFRKHADHGYSFTDCTSFVVMRELALTDALTTDRHFIAAGFKALLPVA